MFPRPAVAAVIQVGDEIFMAQRHNQLLAFPGYWAFPGGKIDAIDTDGKTPAWSGALEATTARALSRELREELGLDLDQLAANGQLLALQPLALATTPPHSPQRFATQFVLIRLAKQPALQACPKEIAALDWATPAEFLDLYHAGQLLIVMAALRLLELLNADATPVDQGELQVYWDEALDVPWTEAIYGVRELKPRSQTLPPADRTNCFLLGDSKAERVLVDPSPNSRQELERLLHTAERWGFARIMLTHHHRDHRQFANDIARRYQVPLAMSADTQSRIRQQQGDAWFDGVTLETLHDGDTLTHWLGEPLRIHAIPGHDAGHLGIAPESLRWFIVGDLIQGIGTVVIAAPEGDMASYFATLQKVIDLQPGIILPSHGIPMGSTFRLEETLKHRRLREAQVLALHQAGSSADDMVAAIYPELKAPITFLARANIDSHLRKLADEQRLD